MSWSIPLDRIAARTGLRMETVARKVTLDVFRSVTVRSPVDTGRFRANWNVSYASPEYMTTTSTNQGRAAIEASKALSIPVGGVVYLANGLPYGPRLEYESWSKQAPSGMIRITVAEFSQTVRRALQ